MKRLCKKAGALLIALSMLFSVGCTKKQIENDETTPKTEYIYDRDMTQISKTNKVAFSEKGYYHIIGDFLYFYDMINSVELPVCSKTDCSHNTSSCNAYAYDSMDYDPYDLKGVSVNVLGNMIWYNDGKLYVIRRDESGDYLMQYDSDFTNEVQLCTLAENGTVLGMTGSNTANTALMYNGYLYYFSVKPTSAKELEDYMTSIFCNRIKVEKDAKAEVLGSFDLAIDYGAFGSAPGKVCAGRDCVYFVSGGTNRFFSENNDVQYRICSYDCNSKKFSIVLNKNADAPKDVLGSNTGNVRPVNGGIVCVDDDNNMYIVTDDTKVVKITPSGDAGIIYSSDAKYITSLIWDGTYIYFSEAASKKGAIVRIDKNGAVKGKYDIVINDEFCEQIGIRGTLLVDVHIGGIDAQNILIYTHNEYIKGLECEAALDVRKFITCAVGIISKKAFDDSSMPIQSIYIYK